MRRPTKKQFQKIILDWYKKNGRGNLPWRKTKDPYKIFVSEVMLQQTQIPRVILKYQDFIKRFPSLAALAKSPQNEVLTYWQGLGYNRRALYAQQCARVICEKFSGIFPHDVHVLESLPGIGPYTARAIVVFSWNQNHVLLETNIRRVMIHFFFSGHSNISDKALIPVLERVAHTINPRRWYWALMDYGAGPLKTIENPNMRSKHYVKQSRFEGSRRYVRAKIISLLLSKKNGYAAAKIADNLRKDSKSGEFASAAAVRSILEDLQREGFICKKGSGYRIA